MNQHRNQPLQDLMESLTAVFPSKTPLALPDAFGEPGPDGDRARELLVSMRPDECKAIGKLCDQKLRTLSWIKCRQRREAAKVILQELSVSAIGTAQEMGLTFATTINKVQDPWLRILVHLEVSELLSRSHIYAPACALAYRQTFANFDDYLNRKEYERKFHGSLFQPSAHADGNPERARVVALEAVLPYGEEALRLMWGLEARAIRDGDRARFKVLRSEELDLSRKLSEWLDTIPAFHSALNSSWHADLRNTLEVSRLNNGHQKVLGQSTPKSHAVSKLIADVENLFEQSDFREADRQLALIRSSLGRDPEIEFSILREQFLYTGYLRALLISSWMKTGADDAPSMACASKIIPTLWSSSESIFYSPGSLWSKMVTEIRLRGFASIPRELREPRTQFPI